MEFTFQGRDSGPRVRVRGLLRFAAWVRRGLGVCMAILLGKGGWTDGGWEFGMLDSWLWTGGFGRWRFRLGLAVAGLTRALSLRNVNPKA